MIQVIVFLNQIGTLHSYKYWNLITKCNKSKFQALIINVTGTLGVKLIIMSKNRAPAAFVAFVPVPDRPMLGY